MKYLKRNIFITQNLVKRRRLLLIHGGMIKNSRKIKPKRLMIGHHVGEYVITKKLGSSIHDSERNKKKKNKKKK